MQPNQQQDNVWISKEEYERLRQQAAQQTVPPAPPQPVVYSASYQVADEPAKVKPSQAIVGALLALGLFLSLTVPLFKFISLPIIAILLIFALMSFNDFRKSKQQSGGSQPLSANTASISGQSKGSGKYHALLVILLVTLAAPVVFFGGLLILFFIFLSSGAAKGS